MTNGAGEQAAFLFPGQGRPDLHRLSELRECASFVSRYAMICDLANCDPLRSYDSDPNVFQYNAVSSLTTVLASTLLLDANRQQEKVAAFAGYSVGQWTALYAAAAIDLETLFRVVHARAGIMDSCMPAGAGMTAVIGVRETDLEGICFEARRRGLQIEIANFNAPLHYTLSGSENALMHVEEQLVRLRPKIMKRIPVSGAWHGAFLKPAVPLFRRYLDDVSLKPMAVPIIDNTTGELLPANEGRLRDHLAAHLASPVQWMKGIKTLVSTGIRDFTEIGIGNTLTNYGFFIDRRAQHVACFHSGAQR